MFERPNHKPISIGQRDVSEARFKRFVKELNAYERKMLYDDTLDAFLDAYSTWLKTHESPLKLRLVMLAFQLHELDPAFTCTLAFQE